MKRQFYFGVVWLVVASGFDSDAFEGDELPCNYTDSINISKGRLDTNDSIIFRGMNFLPSRYAPKVHNGTILPTTRGCLCDQANCIRYCRADDVPDVGSKIEVINDNMKAEEIDLHGNFKIVRGIFCDKRIPSKYQMTPVSEIFSYIFNQQQSNCEWFVAGWESSAWKWCIFIETTANAKWILSSKSEWEWQSYNDSRSMQSTRRTNWSTEIHSRWNW